MGKFVSLNSYRRYPPEEMKQRAEAFRAEMQQRRSVRHFSSEPVARDVIEDCLLAAASAPSGANMQPCSFVAISDPDVKRQIRQAAEKEEYEFYHGRAGQQWLDALSDLETNHHKPFLEEAPYLIAIFARKYGLSEDGETVKHYYVKESVGIATGILIAAIHKAGLVALPYTPARMGFLTRILKRPENERPFIVLVVGYPAADAMVPDIVKKRLEEVATFI